MKLDKGLDSWYLTYHEHFVLENDKLFHILFKISGSPVIGFHVALDHQQSTGGKVAFNRVLSNYGNGWNCVTHTYEVPTKGLYFLTLTLMNYGNYSASAYLRRGSRNLLLAFGTGGHGLNVGTQSTILMLDAGEHIDAVYRSGILYSNDNLYTYLAGFLIQKTD